MKRIQLSTPDGLLFVNADDIVAFSEVTGNKVKTHVHIRGLQYAVCVFETVHQIQDKLNERYGS